MCLQARTQQSGAISITGLNRHFGKVIALKDISLEIGSGEFVTLLGPSGCGKTTLLRMIAGFGHPTSGQIVLGGRDITRMAPEQRPLNMVFQKYALFPHLNVAANIAYGLRNRGIGGQALKDRVDAALAMVDLPGFGTRSVSALSGGQQQRIALARALVNEPAVLLLDEPLSALDKQLRSRMQIELRALQRRLGISFIFVTHDQEEAMTMSDRIVVMRGGKIEQVGSPEDIYHRPASKFVASFVGESTILPARRDRATGEIQLARHAVGNAADGCLVVRPEQWKTEPSGASVAVDGEVIDSIFMGGSRCTLIRLSGGEEIKLSSDRTAHATGDRVTLHLDTSSACFLAHEQSDA